MTYLNSFSLITDLFVCLVQWLMVFFFCDFTFIDFKYIKNTFEYNSLIGSSVLLSENS